MNDVARGTVVAALACWACAGWPGGARGQLPPEAELLAVPESVGFTSVRLTEYFDPFAGTSKERVARKYGVRGVNVRALKP